MTNRLVCLGECMVEMSQAGDGTFRRGFAGDTFNAAWYARRALGDDWAVAYASCIGTDVMSDRMADFMAGEGIATDMLRRVEGRGVGLYMISLAGGERSFTYWRDTSAARTLADDAPWLKQVLGTASHIHLSGITLAILSDTGRRNLIAALAEARKGGIGVSLDTNIRPALWSGEAVMRDSLMSAASVSDIVLPSFDDEATAFGDGTPAETAERYHGAGAPMVIVKNGAGAVLLSSREDGTTPVPASKVEAIVDTTAAGDSFAGAFLAAYLTGVPATEAVRRACAKSAEVIQVHGALAR